MSQLITPRTPLAIVRLQRHHKRPAGGGLILAFALVLSGCALPQKPKIASPERIARIEVNKYTKEDVLGILGLPHDRVAPNAGAGHDIDYWLYYRGRGEIYRVVIVPVPVGGVPVSETLKLIPSLLIRLPVEQRRRIACIIAFDSANRVVEVRSEPATE